jgi:hypothetical protein
MTPENMGDRALVSRKGCRDSETEIEMDYGFTAHFNTKEEFEKFVDRVVEMAVEHHCRVL